MQILWLNDSLVLRAENRDEKSALATVHGSLRSEPEADTSGEVEGSNRLQSVE